MKRSSFAVGLILLVFAISLRAQTQAPKPDPEIGKFDVFLGHWTYVTEYKASPLGPASKTSGEFTCRKILGGFFFQNEFIERGSGGETRAIEMIGYDTVNKKFFTHEYVSTGMMFSGTYAPNGNSWSYAGKLMVMGKPYLIRTVLTPAADSTSFTVKGEISSDGKAWAPFFEALNTRARPVLGK